MRAHAWILDADEDNRTLAGVGLESAGFGSLLFSSPVTFLAHARKNANELPQVAVIDAWTALDCEREIRDAVYSRLVVLTTWPPQLGAWLRVGVSRFLLKHYEIDALLEYVDPDGSLASGRSVSKSRLRAPRGRAA